MRQTLLSLAALSLSLAAHAQGPAPTSPAPKVDRDKDDDDDDAKGGDKDDDKDGGKKEDKDDKKKKKSDSYAGEKDEKGEKGEDKVTETQSVDAFDSLEDAQAGVPGHFEERAWLNYGYVPAEGHTPSETLELSYTPEGKNSYFLRHTEFDLGEYLEHDSVDNTFGINLGWMQRWVKDGGRKSWRPSIGTLTEYFLRTPYITTLPKFAPGATTGDHVAETLTIAKYLGPGTFYLNGLVQHQLFNSEICVNESDVAFQPADAPDQDGPAFDSVNYDGCDYWAPWTFAIRVGYNMPIVEDKLNIVLDYFNETNEFSNIPAEPATDPTPETHYNFIQGEAALMWHVTEHWTISPGVLLGLNSIWTQKILGGDGREETPNYEAGIFILHE